MSESRNSSITSTGSIASADLFYRPPTLLVASKPAGALLVHADADAGDESDLEAPGEHDHDEHAERDLRATKWPSNYSFATITVTSVSPGNKAALLEGITTLDVAQDDEHASRSSSSSHSTHTIGESTVTETETDTVEIDSDSQDESCDTLHDLSPSFASHGTLDTATPVPHSRSIPISIPAPTYAAQNARARKSESDVPSPRERREQRRLDLVAARYSRSTSAPALATGGTSPLGTSPASPVSPTLALPSGPPPVRRMSRKQPPQLTESLELLASSPPLAALSTSSASPATLHVMLPDTPTPRASMSGASAGRHSLDVDLPPLIPPKSAARASSDTDRGPVEYRAPSKGLFGRRKSSLPPLTPPSVAPAASSSPRYSLFSGSVAHRAIHGAAAQRASLESGPSASASVCNMSTPGLSCSGTATESTCGTWEVYDTPTSSGRRGREGRKARKARRKAEAAAFDASTPPSQRALYEASELDVLDEHGARHKFGDLVRGRKTIVVFLRHWFCSMCAQYVRAIVAEVSRSVLDEANVELIIIGNGSARMIDGYAYKHFKSPFKTYTDPTLSLYRALGLTRQTGNGGADEDKGDYVTETILEQTVSTLKRAGKMPLRNPGHFTQLGGEFIFDGPLKAVYTHRMLNTRDHAPIREVCFEAGVRLPFVHYEPGPPPPAVHMRSRTDLYRISEPYEVAQGEDVEDGIVVVRGPGPLRGDDEDELDDWQAERDRTLERIRMLRAARVRGSLESKRPGEEVGDGSGVREDFGHLAHGRLGY